MRKKKKKKRRRGNGGGGGGGGLRGGELRGEGREIVLCLSVFLGEC